MNFFKSFLHAFALSNLAITGYAQSADMNPGDWNPCPSVLEKKNAKEPNGDSRWNLVLSPYTFHWHESAEYKPVNLVGIERYVKGDRFCGLSFFNNSFGQPSLYVYVGQQWNGLAVAPKVFIKFSAGFIYGYKGEHRDVLFYNHSGIAPAVVPAIGYDFTEKDSASLAILGTAGVLFAYGYRF